MTPEEIDQLRGRFESLAAAIDDEKFDTWEGRRRFIRTFHQPVKLTGMRPSTLVELGQMAVHPMIQSYLDHLYDHLAVGGGGWPRPHDSRPDVERARIALSLDQPAGVNGARKPDLVEQENALIANLGSWHDIASQEERDLFPNTGFLGTYMDLSYHSEATLAYHFYVGLSTLGLACRRNLYIPRGNHTTRANTFIFLLGPTNARKSTAIAPAKALINRTNRVLLDRLSEKWSGLTTNVEPVLDPRMNLLADEITDSAIHRDLNAGQSYQDPNGPDIWFHRESSGLLINDESHLIFGKEAMGSGRLIALLTALYEGQMEHTRSTQAHGHTFLRNLALSCLFGSTIEWLQAADESLFQGGFLGRCMLIHRADTGIDIPFPQPVDPIVARQLALDLVPLCLIEQPIAMTLDRDTPAGEEFGRWYVANNKRRREAKSQRVAAYLTRAQGRVLKIAMLLQLSDNIHDPQWLPDAETYGSVPIDKKYIDWAIRITEYEDQFLPFLHEALRAVPMTAEQKQSGQPPELATPVAQLTVRAVISNALKFYSDRSHSPKVPLEFRGLVRIADLASTCAKYHIRAKSRDKALRDLEAAEVIVLSVVERTRVARVLPGIERFAAETTETRIKKSELKQPREDEFELGADVPPPLDLVGDDADG